MPLPFLIPAAVALYSAISASDNQRKAINAQKDAAKASQIDIDKLNEQTKAIARQNAVDSAELERMMTPEVPQMRTEANEAILAGLRDPSLALAQGAIMGGLGDKVGQVQSPLLQAAIAKAKSNLALGGRLPQDVQNSVTRNALENAGTVAPGTLGMGRDLVARDLGLTSLNLENQRIQQAAALGGQEMQLGGMNAGIDQFNSTNMLNQLQMLQSLNNQRFGQSITAGQFAQGIPQPLVGLDPSSVANIAMSNSANMSGAGSNMAAIYGQSSQNNQRLIGQGLGALMAYNQAQNPYTTPGTATTGYGLPSTGTYGDSPYW